MNGSFSILILPFLCAFLIAAVAAGTAPLPPEPPKGKYTIFGQEEELAGQYEHFRNDYKRQLSSLLPSLPSSHI